VSKANYVVVLKVGAFVVVIGEDDLRAGAHGGFKAAFIIRSF
jgi:hypothetical protein